MVDEAGQRRTALTIAGFDPGSGAGVTADLLTLARCGVFATSAITALTVQSTRGVRRVEPVDAELLRETLAELEIDLPADGVKIGMLGGAAQVRVVAEFVRAARSRRELVVVVDPVLLSSSGARLLDAKGLEALQDVLLPEADAVTPNLDEAAVLTGLPCGNADEAERCARELAERYPRLTPIVTGGHLEPPSDLLWDRQAKQRNPGTGGCARWIAGERIPGNATHGTGCVYSSALLAARLLGREWDEAAVSAKSFVAEAMRRAEPRGSGKGPMHLLD